MVPTRGPEAPGEGGLAREAVARLEGELDAAGLDVRGALTGEVWDGCVAAPFRREALLSGAGAVWLLGAGAGLFAAAAAGPDGGGSDPLDRHVARTVRATVATLRGAGLRAVPVLGHVPAAGGFADLVAAARAAGLGWPSRLGLLLHPVRGPWWSLRAAILTDAALAPGHPRTDASPCTGCHAPCTRVCPGAAPGPGGFDVARCAAVRAADPRCALRCDARRACPVGAAHRYEPGDEARLMRASRAAVLAHAGRAPPGAAGPGPE